MAQIDDLQAYTNLEIPRRPVLLTNAIASYDGNPNDAGAPAIVSGSPTGTLFHEETADVLWWKNDAGDFVAVTTRPFAPITTIYVDPTGGDDANDGSVGSPIQTLSELRERMLTNSDSLTVNLLAGTHELPSFTGTNDRFIFGGSNKRTFLNGATSTVLAVTITGYTDNVATVSETLTTNAHMGQFIEIVVSATFTRRLWVISNDTTSLTLAQSVGSFLGNITVAPGSYNLVQCDATISQPTSGATSSSNRFYYDGEIVVNACIFDQSINGGNTGPTALTDGAKATFLGCKWLGDWSVGLSGTGETRVLGCWFERTTSGSGYAVNGVGRLTFIGNDCVFKNYGTAILGGYTGETVISSHNVVWALNVATFMESDGGVVRDQSAMLWVDATMTTYMKFSGPTQYTKEIDDLVGITGHKSLGVVYEAVLGGVSAHLQDSSATDLTIGTTFIRTPTGDLALADYLAGTGIATGTERLLDDVGNLFYY